MVEQPTQKELAEFFRIGLRVGLFTPSNVVRWADAVILAEDKPDIEIIEVSLAGGGGLRKMIDALSEVKGEARTDYPIKLMLAYCWKQLRTRQWTADSFTGLLYNLRHASKASEDMDYDLIRLDEDLYLAREMIYGTVEEVMDDIENFLKPFEEYEPYLPDDIYTSPLE